MLGIIILTLIIAGYCLLDIRSLEPKQIDKKAIAISEQDAKERREAKRPDVSEPYDDQHFYDDPQNFDLDGFWQSYKDHH